MSSDWGSKCWDRSDLIVAFFHLYNALLENNHLKPIKILDGIMQVFGNGLFKAKCPKLGILYAFGTASKLVGSGRKRGGAPNSQSTFGKPNLHSKFLNVNMLFELSKALWKSTRADSSKFTSLAKHPRHFIDFLDAVKADLETDFHFKTSIATLNYHGILTVIIFVLMKFDRTVMELPSVRRIMPEYEERELVNRIMVLALHRGQVVSQDSEGLRLDTPILRELGKTLESF